MYIISIILPVSLTCFLLRDVSQHLLWKLPPSTNAVCLPRDQHDVAIVLESCARVLQRPAVHRDGGQHGVHLFP